MSYRNEGERGIVLQAEFETAQSYLEQLADSNRSVIFDDNPQLDVALTTLGFRKERLNGPFSFVSDFPFVYVRDTEKEREVLADKNLGRASNSEYEFHLYKISTEKTVRDWYGKRDNSDKRILSPLELAACIGVTFFPPTSAALLGSGLSQENSALLYAGIASLTISIGIGIGIVRLYGNRNKIPLQDQMAATGSNALRYIAHNSTYEAPPLRAPKVPVNDDEFTEDTDQQVYQEQLGELAAGQEAVGIEKLALKRAKA